MFACLASLSISAPLKQVSHSSQLHSCVAVCLHVSSSLTLLRRFVHAPVRAATRGWWHAAGITFKVCNILRFTHLMCLRKKRFHLNRASQRSCPEYNCSLVVIDIVVILGEQRDDSRAYGTKALWQRKEKNSGHLQ